MFKATVQKYIVVCIVIVLIVCLKTNPRSAFS